MWTLRVGRVEWITTSEALCPNAVRRHASQVVTTRYVTYTKFHHERYYFCVALRSGCFHGNDWFKTKSACSTLMCFLSHHGTIPHLITTQLCPSLVGITQNTHAQRTRTFFCNRSLTMKITAAVATLKGSYQPKSTEAFF